MEQSEIIVYNVNMLCKNNGITQKELAKKLGKNPVSFNQTISGRVSVPSLKTLMEIAQFFAVPVASLLLQPDEQITQQQQQQPAQQVKITCPHCQQSISITIN